MFQGVTSNPEGAVGAGLDTIIMQEGRIISFGSGLNFDIDYELEGIRTLGFHGDRFFKSMGLTASLSIETYVIRRANEPGALHTPGFQSDGKFNANTAGEFDFVVADVNSLTILFTMLKCKLSTESVQFPSRGLNTKSTSWRTTRVSKSAPSYSNVCRKFREIGGTPNVNDEGNTEEVSSSNEKSVTTIRKEYTQASGSAGHPVMGDDIVSSNRKLLAA